MYSLKNRIVMIMGAVFLAFFAISSLFISNIIEKPFVSIENNIMQLDFQRIINTHEIELDNREAVVKDWAHWDDTYRFMIDHEYRDVYISSNMMDSTFTTTGNNLIAYIDNSGKVIYAKMYDLENERTIPLPEDFSKVLEGLGVDKKPIGKGLIMLDGRPMTFNMLSILTSNGEGPSRGWMFMGRYVSVAQLQSWSSITQLKLAKLDNDDNKLPQAIHDSMKHTKTGWDTAIVAMDGSNIRGYVVFRDVFGFPLFTLMFEQNRDIFQQGQQTIRIFNTLSVITTAGLFIVMVLLIQSFVLNRIGKLSVLFGKIAGTSDFSLRAPVDGNDEMGQLAKDINHTLDVLKCAHEGVEREMTVRTAIAEFAQAMNDHSVSIEIVSEIVIKHARQLTRSEHGLVSLISDHGILSHNHEDREITGKHIAPTLFAGEKQFTASPKAGDCGLFTHVLLSGNELMQNSHAKICMMQNKEEASVEIFSFLAVPVVSDGKIIGQLALANSHEGFSERDASVLRRFSEFFVIAIHHAKHRAQMTENEAKYRLLFESELDAILLVDADTGIIVDVNTSACNLYGYEKDVFLAKTIDTIFDDASIAKELMARTAREHSLRSITCNHKNSSGTLFPVEVSTGVFEWKGRNIVCEVCRDLSEHRKAEAEKDFLLQQLVQAQKMETIGTLAGGVAHDFNNMLCLIMGNVQLARTDCTVSDSVLTSLCEIEKAAERASELTTKLLTFARQEKINVRSVKINRILDDVITILHRSMPKTIAIRSVLAEGLNPVNVDENQISQVLLNICNNARDAMPNGGSIIIESSHVNVDEAFMQQHIDAIAGEYCMIQITDTGTGMSEETKGRVFDPFFTTKDVGKGTGLGLSISYGIVKRHGGFITVYSESGIGTSFKVYLPFSDDAEYVETKSDATILSGTETILIVDDETAVLKLAGKVLRKAGYQVFIANTGRMALDLYKDLHDDIAVVILDMIMPEMDGAEIYRGLKKINPEVKVILASGYSIDGQASQLIVDGISGFIQKPFSIVKLCKTIRDVID